MITIGHPPSGGALIKSVGLLSSYLPSVIDRSNLSKFLLLLDKVFVFPIFSGTLKVAEVTNRFNSVPNSLLLLDEVFVFPISVEP